MWGGGGVELVIYLRWGGRKQICLAEVYGGLQVACAFCVRYEPRDW